MKQPSPLRILLTPKTAFFRNYRSCFLQAFYIIYFNNIYFNKRFFKCCDQYPTKNQ
ncbi:hypothetical protein HPHPP3B_0935 [Helicobacter pylori Hp P-3b]|nr:hypothetical protein HPHPP3B_0935 [Helicobacter pylori Hp P-3b]